MRLPDDDLLQLVSDIWNPVLGLAVAPIEPPVGRAGRRSLTGCISIQGNWEGWVTLECPTELASKSASLMFGMDLPELSPAEIDDALGELTNITGGGVKALVPGPCQLSLPAVVEGTDYTLSIPGCHLVNELWFETEGDAFVVRVLERSSQSRAA